MKKSVQQKIGTPNRLQLLEEGVYLLRHTPVNILLKYLVGTIPFMTLLVFYIQEMSESCYAVQRSLPLSLALAFGYLWMKSWQTIFVAELHQWYCSGEAITWKFGRVAKLISTQTILQVPLLLLMPFSACSLFLFPLFLMLSHSFTFFGDGSTKSLRAVLGKSFKTTAKDAKKSIHLGAIIILFSIIIFINVMIGFYFIPHFSKTIFGINTFLSNSSLQPFSLSMLSIGIGTTYLLCDSLLRCIFLLKIFYQDSLTTGMDLKVALNRFKKFSKKGVLLLITATFFAIPSLMAQENSPANSAKQLDQAITKEAQHQRYNWREVVQKADKKELPFLEKIFKYLEDFFEWLAEKLFGGKGVNIKGSSNSLLTLSKVLLYALLFIVIIAVIVIIYKIIRSRRNRSDAGIIELEADVATPNLEHDELSGAELAAEDWLSLAEKMITDGNKRLAIRSLYLASLAHLAERNLIRIIRYKTNSDYQQEMLRRGHALPKANAAFRANSAIFDCVWYGLQLPSDEQFSTFKQNLRILDQGEEVVYA